MIGDIALCILATCTGTGIDTFLIQASFVGRTVGAERALRSTAGIRIALIVGKTAADAIAALSIGSTWLEVARIYRRNRWLWCSLLDNLDALDKRIAGKTTATRANRQMVLYAALGVNAAGSVARIATLLGNAGTI